MDKPVYHWDDAALGRLVKDIARNIGEDDADLMALATAACATLAGTLNVANAPAGTFDLKGVVDGQGNPIGDFVVNVTKLSDEPFPEPPRKIDIAFQKNEVVGGLNLKQLQRLAYLYAASKLEVAATKDAPSVWPENKDVFREIQPIVLDEIVSKLLRKSKCSETSPSFDEAINLIKLQINKGKEYDPES